MTVASSLSNAATLASANLYALWTADTLQAACVAFAAQANAIFTEQDESTHPLSNWIAVISSNAQTVKPYEQSSTVGFGTITTWQAMVTFVYRLYALADYFEDEGIIGSSQVTALLAAYNANFA